MIIVWWLLFVLTFGLGFAIGWLKFDDGSVTAVKRELKKFVHHPAVGLIKHPTAKDIALKKNPQLKGELDAMTETLEKIL